MLKDIKRIVGRADTVAADAVGAISLMVILVMGLHLPLFV